MLTHYENLAENFDRAWFFTEDYQAWMSEKILKFLEFKPDDLLVDIGAGTGIYTARIHALGGGKVAPVCVEPSSKMAAVAMANHGLSVYQEDAHTFSRHPMKYDKVLVKETIHHIENRVQLWQGLRRNLCDNGRVLVVTRPQTIQWPLFRAAKEMFARNQPAADCLAVDMEKAGFSIGIYSESFKLKLPRKKWFEMLRTRFISDLSRFSDEEIEAGVSELTAKYPDETIEIEDSLLFIVGY